MGIPRTSSGIARTPNGIPAPSGVGTVITPPSSVTEVLWLYGDVKADGTIPSGGSPFQPMRLADIGNEGFSGFRDIINSMTGPNGETYNITEMYDMDFDPATDLVGIKVLYLASSQRVFTSQEWDLINGWLENTMTELFGPEEDRGIVAFSDSALGGGSGAAGGGYQNQVGQTARAVIFNPDLQVLVDQVDGTTEWTIPAAHPLSGGSNLTWQGEGHSPCRLNPAGNAVSVIDYDDPTPTHTQGISSPYTGTYSILATIENGNSRKLYVGDRNWGWNGGAGSNINQFDNAEFSRNQIKWAAHHI